MLPPGQPRPIGAQWARSNAIEQHVVVARSAAATMVRIAGVAVVAALEAMAAAEEAEVLEAVVVVFEEAVAGADGIIGAIP
jgi:hypothetical protein